MNARQIIKALTRVSIDAYVCHNLSYAQTNYSKEEDVYRFTTALTPLEEGRAGRGAIGGPKIVAPRYTLSRPNSEGHGGGVLTRVDVPQTGTTGTKTVKGASASAIEDTDWA